MPLYRNIRFWVLLTGFVWSVGVYWYLRTTVLDNSVRSIYLGQVYGLTALSFLYVTLLAGPFCYTFPSFPWRTRYIRARRALGVSTFYFSCLHAYQTFFQQIGGLSGLEFLNDRYLLAISLSTTALLIFTAMASTSFDRMIRLLNPQRWKTLHRLVYTAGIFVLIHALMLGTHYRNVRSPVAVISFVLLAGLVLLEAKRVDAWLGRLFPNKLPSRLVFYLTVAALVSWLLFLLLSEEATLGIRAD